MAGHTVTFGDDFTITLDSAPSEELLMLSNWIVDNSGLFEDKSFLQLCTNSSKGILPALVASHFTKEVEVILICDSEHEADNWINSPSPPSKSPITKRFVLWKNITEPLHKAFENVVGANLFVEVNHEMDICGLVQKNFEGKEEGDLYITFEKELTCTDSFFDELEKTYEAYAQELQSAGGKEIMFCQFTKLPPQ